MSRASNSLKTSDVLTTPIKLKYTASFESGSTESAGIRFYVGQNESFDLNSVPSREALTYRSIRHLYYSNYLTGSVQTTASYADNWLQSTAVSGTIEADQRRFPTGPDEMIQVISVPREVFGEKIARKSFRLVGEDYELVDDGNGNVWDASTVPGFLLPLFFTDPDLYFKKVSIYGTHVGNIIYAQGMVIITNQDYITILGNVNYLLQENSGIILTENLNNITLE